MTSDFINPINRTSARPPYIGLKAVFQAGWIKGKKSNLQSMLDSTVNAIYQSEHQFLALSDYVLYTALHTDEVRSTEPRDRHWGYVPEIDITFWILTWGGKKADKSDWKLRWTPTYMYVDDMAAVITGREVFGFPKALASIKRTSKASGDFGLSVQSAALEKLGYGEEFKERLIFTVRSTGKSDTGKFDELEIIWRAVLEAAVIGAPDIARAAVRQLRLADGQVPFPILLLKQIPAISSSGKASYQKLIEAQMTSTRIGAAGKAPSDIELLFEEPASAQIAKRHGFPVKAKLQAALWVEQDYATGFGREL